MQINHCCNENIIKVNVEQIDKDNVRVTVYNSGKNIPRRILNIYGRSSIR